MKIFLVLVTWGANIRFCLLWENVKGLEFKSVLDAFSGSACVSYMFKQKGFEVYSNDFMAFSANFTKALIENSDTKLDDIDIKILLNDKTKIKSFVRDTFKDLYFDDEDNYLIDKIIANTQKLSNDYKKSLALAAITRACLKSAQEEYLLIQELDTTTVEEICS